MKRRAFTAIFLAAFWAFAATAQDEPADLPETVPNPEARPIDALPRTDGSRPHVPQQLQISKPELEEAAKLCESVLAKDKVVGVIAGPAVFDNGCGAVGQVTISAIKLKDGKQVTFRPTALVRCEIVDAIADWVRDDLVPASEAYSGVARVEVAASYHCRPRNNIRGALMSEHGRANAIDIRAIVMSDGRRFGVDLPETPIQLLSDLRRSACARFTTVLGPGSDGYHENHFHMDLAQRRGGFRLCQWNLPAPPNPPQNPLRVRYP